MIVRFAIRPAAIRRYEEVAMLGRMPATPDHPFACSFGFIDPWAGISGKTQAFSGRFNELNRRLSARIAVRSSVLLEAISSFGGSNDCEEGSPV